MWDGCFIDFLEVKEAKIVSVSLMMATYISAQCLARSHISNDEDMRATGQNGFRPIILIHFPCPTLTIQMFLVWMESTNIHSNQSSYCRVDLEGALPPRPHHEDSAFNAWTTRS